MTIASHLKASNILYALFKGINWIMTTLSLSLTPKPHHLKALNIWYALSLFTANTNWGTKFHTGFLQTATDAALSLDIYTPGRGTRVRITGTLSSATVDETILVTRDGPVSFWFCLSFANLTRSLQMRMDTGFYQSVDYVLMEVTRLGRYENSSRY